MWSVPKARIASTARGVMARASTGTAGSSSRTAIATAVLARSSLVSASPARHCGLRRPAASSTSTSLASATNPGDSARNWPMFCPITREASMSTATHRNPSASRPMRSRAPVSPTPHTRKNGSRSPRTCRRTRSARSTSSTARSCMSASSCEISHAQPNTDR